MSGSCNANEQKDLIEAGHVKLEESFISVLLNDDVDQSVRSCDLV